MAAPKGNQFWLERERLGRKRKFEDAEALANACVDYFEWIEANPIYESQLVTFRGRGKLHSIPKVRAMTIHGLCAFIGVSRRTWRGWRNDPDYGRPDLIEVMDYVEDMIYMQKFENAAAGLLNANIISRDLGLAEKHDHSSSDGSMVHRPTTIELVAVAPKKAGKKK